LVSESTDKSYLDYLKEREYDFVVAGEKQIDLKKSFDVLSDRYETNTVLVDSGRGLTNAMLNQGLVDEISLLVLPVIVGEKSENLFSNITKQVKLTELKEETFPGGYVHLHYKLINKIDKEIIYTEGKAKKIKNKLIIWDCIFVKSSPVKFRLIKFTKMINV
jgi:2,5-diamino-6-(ribosylamino)-4(3H)-pyrimidinone 5'-phosphate reductase